MAKNVDACYRNILEKFNPGSRQLINAGKCYLKALHGAAAAAKVYLESLSRVAKQAQQGTCGGTADIGNAMEQMVEVQREIQTQQINTLKAFYIDLIAPLENNIEKDTKVVQADHKKFNQLYKTKFEIYNKTALVVKKHSKKSAEKKHRSSSSYNKEIKHLTAMEEEKAKLGAFCEISLREAITQERKRYGFVLERQTSLSKHFLAHYGKGAALMEKHLDGWQETSRAREELPPCVEFLLGNTNGREDNMYALPRTPDMILDDEEDNFCSASQMRKSHSIDTSYLYEDTSPSFHEAVNPKVHAARSTIIPSHLRPATNLCKSKSEYNLSYVSGPRSVRSERGSFGTTGRPKSIALPSAGRIMVKAMYAYLSSGEHQINFLEGDLIQLLGDEPISFHNSNGDRNKGWYYGENLRTGKRGWFPLAYTEQVRDTDDVDSGLGLRSQLDSCGAVMGAPGSTVAGGDTESTTSGNSSASNSSAGRLKNLLQLRLKASNHKSPAQSSTLRPVSLLGDRALLSKVPGFNKLRKSRSAFAERLLCAAATPAPPPGSAVDGAAAGAASAGSPALTAGLLSPTKKAPAPPPRLSVASVASVAFNGPTCHSHSHSYCQPHINTNTTTTNHDTHPLSNMTDVSLRSSNDSGFVNENVTGPPLAPPAPEIDYSDEESLK